MITKCGIDVVLNERFGTINEGSVFVEKVFNPSEIQNPSKYISIFSIKESVFKALELENQPWLEIEVTYKENGKTSVNLSDLIRPKNFISIDSSVSHAEEYTISVVIINLSC